MWFQLEWDQRTRKFTFYSHNQRWILSVWVCLPKAWHIIHDMSDMCDTVFSSLVLLFCTFHHAHIMEKHSCQSLLSKFALVFGVVAAVGSFTAGNCNVSTAPPAECVWIRFICGFKLLHQIHNVKGPYVRERNVYDKTVSWQDFIM